MYLQLDAVVALSVVICILDLGPSWRCHRNVAPIHSTRTHGKALRLETGHTVCELLARGGLHPFSHHVLADGMAHKPSDDAACVAGHPKLIPHPTERVASGQTVNCNRKTLPRRDASSIFCEEHWPGLNVHLNLTVQIFEPAASKWWALSRDAGQTQWKQQNRGKDSLKARQVRAHVAWSIRNASSHSRSRAAGESLFQSSLTTRSHQ